MAKRKGKIGDIDKDSVDSVAEWCKECSEKKTKSKAVKYCMICKDYLCETCVNSHKSKQSDSGHAIVRIPDKGNVQYLTSVMTCQEHPGQIMDMICKTHDEIGCFMCMNSKHEWLWKDVFLDLEALSKDYEWIHLLR